MEPDIISATSLVTDNGTVIDIDEEGQRGLLIISRGTALLLLGVYVAYLVFQLKTHFALFQAKKKVLLKTEQESDDEEALLSPPLTATTPGVSRANAGLPSEIQQEEEEEETAEMSVISASVMYVVSLYNAGFNSLTVMLGCSRSPSSRHSSRTIWLRRLRNSRRGITFRSRSLVLFSCLSLPMPPSTLRACGWP